MNKPEGEKLVDILSSIHTVLARIHLRMDSICVEMDEIHDKIEKIKLEQGNEYEQDSRDFRQVISTLG